MTDPRRYIDEEFEQMRKMAIKGKRDEGIEATLKLTFIAGMSAALGFDGNDAELLNACKPAMQAISAKYGGRTIFPIGLTENGGATRCNHADGKSWHPRGDGTEVCGICRLVRDADSKRKQEEVSEGLAHD
jgi:hypothetical protein